VIAYADGADTARSSPQAVADAAGVSDTEVLLGWTPEDRPWLASPGLRGRTVLAGYALGRAVADGRLEYVPARLSAMPRLVAGVLRPDVAVVTGRHRGGELVFGASVGWGPALARAARTGVVVELDETGPDLGGPAIPGTILAMLPRPPAPGPAPAPRPPDATELAIGHHVVALLPEDATVQAGIGGTADAVLAAIDRPVRLWSGLISEAAARLHQRDLLVGDATATYVWGGEAVADLAAAGRLRLVPLEESHDLTRVSAIDRFVACNTALQVGLDGSVNVEVVGGRYVAGVGGHADYCAAAARSVGGLSIVALRSTTRSGASTIVPRVEVVSTPRCDVDVVVTEHGVADLRGVGDAERGRRIAAIAAPEHRARLLSVPSTEEVT
jgi:acyl-CoA hydrolase